MTESYTTLVKAGTSEIVEKKSRFLGYTASVHSEEEAYAFVETIRKKHYDARHNCFAYSIGHGLPNLRFSDDGEPQGTAGKPILDVITNSGIDDLCIVVTRYFGGTLLGTGGLVRAYTDAAREAVANSETKVMQHLQRIRISSNYSDIGKIQYIVNSSNIAIINTEYADNVVITVDVPFDMRDKFKKDITEATAARAVIEDLEELFG